jgi:hypothetical protein
MELDRNGLEVLGRDESLRLLSSAVLGRIAITSGALPTVLPVNFRWDGRRILFRTGEGTRLSAAILAGPARRGPHVSGSAECLGGA